jgi:hypothetical protein
VFEAAHVFFPQINPILSEFNFYQATIAGFITNGSADLAGDFGGQRYQTQLGIIEPRSFSNFPVKTRPATERGQAYLAPNALTRGVALGGYESFDCKPSGGEQKDAVDTGTKSPPCFVSPPSLYNGKSFIKPGKGQAPLKRAPKNLEGSSSADPNQR